MPPVARAFHLRVLQLRHATMGLRYKRDLKTLCTILDLGASGKGAQLMDVVAQRIKAIEKAVVDGGDWPRAQYLEVMDPESATMLTKDEEVHANRVYRSEALLNQGWKILPKGRRS